jgi:hypothetical protein
MRDFNQRRMDGLRAEMVLRRAAEHVRQYSPDHWRDRAGRLWWKTNSPAMFAYNILLEKADAMARDLVVAEDEEDAA